MKKRYGILLILIAGIIIFFNLKSSKDNAEEEIVLKQPSFEYGILTDTFHVIKDTVKKGQTLGEIFYLHHIDHPQIHQIVQKSKSTFDVRRVNAGKPYMVMCSQDSIKKAEVLVYEQDAINYIVFDLRQGISVYRGKKEVVVRLKKKTSLIKSDSNIIRDESGYNN